MIKIFFMVIKNLRIVLRSWTSIFLLIIGPLALISVIGIALSGNLLHDIKIGVFAKDYDVVNQALSGMSSIGIIVKYNNIPKCIDDMKKAEVHICLEFSDDFMMQKTGKKVPTGTITIFYDNSNMKLSQMINGYIKANIGVAARQISLDATRAILSNIEDSVRFMENSKASVTEMISNTNQMKKDLNEFRNQLQDIKNKFDPKYREIKRVQSQINSNKNSIESAKNSLNTGISSLNNELYSLQQELDPLYDTLNNFIREYDNFLIEVANLNDPNLYNKFLNFKESMRVSSTRDLIFTVKNSLTKVRKDLTDVNSNINDNIYTIYEAIDQFNAIVVELDTVSLFLSEAIQKSNENINRLDSGMDDLYRVQSTLNENVDKFSGLTQEQASSLTAPITTILRPLFTNVKNTYMMFPNILVMILVFISILLSCIIVLGETHSSAYFRNFIIPLKSIYFVVGLFITNLIIASFQILVLLTIARYVMNIDVFSNFLPIALVIVLLLVIFSFIGMIFAYLFESQETSVLTSTFFVLGIFLFSDLLVPLEFMPKTATLIAGLNPLVVGASLFRKIIFFNIPLGECVEGVMVLLVYIVILAVILSFIHTLSKKRIY